MVTKIRWKLALVAFPFLLLPFLQTSVVDAQQMSRAEGIEFFESKIRPVLVRECYGCHSKQAGQERGGLTLDTKQGMLVGGDSGTALVPGDLDESPLWSAINYEDYAMPPNKQLSADIIEDFRIWIEAGAPDPRSNSAKKHEIQTTVTAADIKEGRKFWSFQRPRKSDMKLAVQHGDSEWANSTIDHFVEDKLKEKNLTPAVDADPRTLLRRLSYDLIGLPPTPKELEEFVAAWEGNADEALDRTIDRLLASPQFGERWGRHWLDVVRYAESSGKEVNATFPHAWRYRNYVIDSFNEDKPYDRFIQEQIAGDLLPVRDNDQWAENLVATGFLALGPKTLTERNPRQFRADLIDEQIDVTTRVVMGVSVACARCHDHKFDPIPQSDYYAMAGIFASTETYYGTIDARQNRRPSDLILLPIDDLAEFEKPLTDKEVELIKTEIEKSRDKIREVAGARRQNRDDPEAARKFQAAQRVRRQEGARISNLESILSSYDKDGKPKSFCMGTQPAAKPVDVNLLVRGEVDQPADTVPRGFVQVIGGRKGKIRDNSSGRLELAKWMTDESNPLTARVMVNRIWQHLMGQGIVETPENFGATGMPPTHPELLDYLALQFMDNDWSMKSMIREIVSSRTYRMSSSHNSIAYEKDPDNKLLWRHSPKRLQAEALRDSMLQLAGKLKSDRPSASEVARGGNTVARNGRLTSARDLLARYAQQQRANEARMEQRDDQEKSSRRRMSRAERNRARAERQKRAAELRRQIANQPSTDPDHDYRSVYLPIVRDSVPRALAVFDFAESTMVVGKRETSNTPDQGLYFLNNQRVIEASEQFAKRVLDHPGEIDEKISRAFVMAYCRPPTASELQAALQFFEDFDVKTGPKAEQENMAYLCQALMAAAEFRIIN